MYGDNYINMVIHILKRVRKRNNYIYKKVQKPDYQLHVEWLMPKFTLLATVNLRLLSSFFYLDIFNMFFFSVIIALIVIYIIVHIVPSANSMQIAYYYLLHDNINDLNIHVC